MARMLAATGCMAVVLWLVQRALFGPPLHGSSRMMALAGLVIAGLLAYGIAAVAFGAADWEALRPFVARARARNQ
jgi:hypothetical protein